MVASAGDGDGAPASRARDHGGQLLRLDADDADFGVGLLERAGDAADESAAADGHDDGFELGHLFEEFEADGALAGDDVAGRRRGG